MKFISFTSGSCGNCYYIGDDCSDPGTGILIDAGASMRRVRQVMMKYGIPTENINAILITHDHLDHIRFLGTYCKYLKPAVYTTHRLHGVLAVHSFTKDHIAGCRHILQQGWNSIGPFEVRWFDVPHDATQTVGYAVRCASHLLVLMTDLEHVTEEALELARQADTVVIESNYDYNMLVNGPYPAELKTRILKQGHLSNEACAEAIKNIYHPGLRNLFLCHLSENNNTPEKAYGSALAALEEIGVGKGEINLRTLDRYVASPVINL